MNRFTVPEDGQYQVRTHDPARRAIRVLMNGALLNEECSNLPDGKPEVNIIPTLARGAVITTEPEDAPLLVVRMPDETVVYDTTR